VTDALEEVRGYCVTMPAALLQVSLDLQAAPEALPGHKEQAEWLHVTSAALCVCVEKIVPGIASLAGPALVCMAAIAFAFVVTNGLCCSSSCCNGAAPLERSLSAEYRRRHSGLTGYGIDGYYPSTTNPSTNGAKPVRGTPVEQEGPHLYPPPPSGLSAPRSCGAPPKQSRLEAKGAEGLSCEPGIAMYEFSGRAAGASPVASGSNGEKSPGPWMSSYV